MKLLKVTLIVCSFFAGLAVTSCLARDPHCHGYDHYGGRPNYYGHGTHFYGPSNPYNGYGYNPYIPYPYGAPPVIIVKPPCSGWQSGGIYGRNYYHFGN